MVVTDNFNYLSFGSVVEPQQQIWESTIKAPNIRGVIESRKLCSQLLILKIIFSYLNSSFCF